MRLQHIDGQEIVSAGIDYLRFTLKNDNPDVEFWHEEFAEQIAIESQLYGPATAIQLQGYQGWKSRHVMYGCRKDGWMFQVSSELADVIGKELLEHGTKAKVTRLDLQATVKYPEAIQALGASARTIIRANERQEGRRRGISITVVEAPGGGDSCSVGSRGSERFARIYNKTAEQQGRIAENCYRFELELKGKQANQFWGHMDGLRETHSVATGAVAYYLYKLGFREEWMSKTMHMKLPTTYEPTSDERRLNWFKTQVVPVFRKIESDDVRIQIAALLGMQKPEILNEI